MPFRPTTHAVLSILILLWTGIAHADPGSPPSVSSAPPSVSPTPPVVSPAPPALMQRNRNMVVRRGRCRVVVETDIFGRTREVRRCGSRRF